jgi:hypothetical protein
MSDQIALDAEQALDAFIQVHRAAAIPALVGAMCMWAVENGGADLMKGTLARAIAMVDEMAAIKKRSAQ